MSRFIPTRAGVINLWDYRDEEFVFADGWLVLRGPNGSGKTKALEVLFPFVLDGRIEPRRLNPFASEDRTMKSNLLYRGQESALAYVWLEFGNGTEHVTVGVGLRAQRHNDKVTRWYFVTDGQVGVDFALLDEEDRPIVRKHLVSQLGAEAVRDNAEEHRAAIDARLFGLGRERYEQLLNLVLTLRKPQLAKNLDPVSLSNTLADGLRPLDEDLLTEAARSFDDMEAVQLTLDGLVAADEATRAFLAIYTTYLRTHARSAADKLTRRRAATLAFEESLVTASGLHRQAQAALAAAQHALAEAGREPPRLRAHLDRLKLSDVYKSQGQLADLERIVGELAKHVKRADEALAGQRRQTASRQRELVSARQAFGDREAELSRLIRALATDAEAAGIPWQAGESEPDGFHERATARVTARQDDIRSVREAATHLDRARQDRTRTAAALAEAQTAVEKAEDTERLAALAVEQSRTEARNKLDTWAEQHSGLLSAIAQPDLAADLQLALAATGEPDAATLQTVFVSSTSPALQDLRDLLGRLRTEQSNVEAEQMRLEAERAAIAAERDDAPALWPARPAPRADRPGAPLWRLVRFADDLPSDQAAGLEAALEAANLLDAWVSPTDGDLDEDGYLHPLPLSERPTGATLADVLRIEDQDFVAAARVLDILQSISLGSVTGVSAAAPIIDRRGRFAQGIQIGSLTKAAPEFIGATARAHRRSVRLAEYDSLIAGLTRTRASLGERINAEESTVDAIALAGRTLPPAGPIANALREHHKAAVLLHGKRENADAAAVQHDVAVASVSAAEAGLRRTCADRAINAEQLDDIAGAVQRFELCAHQVVASRRERSTAAQHVEDATERLNEASEVEASAEQAFQAAQQKHAIEAEQVETLRSLIGDPEAQAILTEVKATEQAIDDAEEALVAARTADVDAQRAVAATERDVANGNDALRIAIKEELTEAQQLEPFAHPDLLELLRCPAHLRWPAEQHDGALPAEILALHEAINTATKELTPTETSLKQTSTRLTRALDELQTELAGAGQDYRPEWTTDGGLFVVRVADEDGYAPIKIFADRITGHRRDQEMLLTDAERRILEDTLLASLARQIHQRTIDARDLVDAMDQEMRKRRMSSGVTIGVGWQLADSLDEDQRTVCKLLEKNPARLSPGDLTTMRKHFAVRIKAARATRGDRTYRDLLADVLDYRRWRVFAFRLHRPGSSPETLTKARHSQLSGGEQSVSLHLPLFAAAHALFTSAQPGCPRLLALDEAFAGVDETGRSELMALAVQFDLDLFMTGYDLFATHATVPGCAHYELSHSPSEHLVSGLLMVWDGTETLADFDGSLVNALGSPGTRSRAFIAPSALSEEDDVLI